MEFKRIFIIGGNSYLGFELLSLLLMDNLDYEIYYVSRTKGEVSGKNLFYLSSEDFFSSDLKYDQSIVFYFVSLDRSECMTSQKLADINVGLFSKAMRKFMHSRILYLSTFSVYRDNWDFISLSEQSPIEFTHTYALTHYLCEVIGRDLASILGNEFYIGRLTNSFGWHSRIFAEKYVLNSLMLGAVYNNEVNLQSDGNFVRDFIFISDVLLVLEKFITRDIDSLPQIFNISSSKSYLVRDVASLVRKVAEEVLDKRVSLMISGNSINNFAHSKCSPVSHSVVQSSLNLNWTTDFISLERGIEKSLSNLQSLIG